MDCSDFLSWRSQVWVSRRPTGVCLTVIPVLGTMVQHYATDNDPGVFMYFGVKIYIIVCLGLGR